MKQCRICMDFYPIDNFCVDNKSPDKKGYRCLLCRRSYQKEYKNINNLKIKEKAKIRAQKPEFKIKHQKYRDSRKLIKQEYDKNRRLEKREELLDQKRKYYKDNKEKLYSYRNQPYIKDKKYKYNKIWNKNNTDIKNYHNANRRALLIKATPTWLTDEHKKEIKEFYKKAKTMSKNSNIKYEVDHIIPLKSKIVCGLHVPWNLQILSKTENLKKRNTI